MFRPPKVCSNVPLARKLSEGSNYGIQGFNVREVENKTLIGQGAFGKVYRASYKTKDVVLKELHGVEEKDIVREARFLNHLRHENLVEFVGMSLEEQSLMLEYLGFDFAAFGKDVTVSNLEEFLHQMKISQFCGFEHFPGIITNDIVNGIKYLHSKGVAHRALKPSNILISNKPFLQLSDWTRRKVPCGDLLLALRSLQILVKAGVTFARHPWQDVRIQ